MGPYLNRFSIRDLENFSGVKAHTIRIWERRYGILAPDRTDTNIRTYGLDELKTILNVAFLNRHGLKISRIADLSASEREQRVRNVAEGSSVVDGSLDALKLAMVSYDPELFERTSEDYREREGFRALVEHLYVPLLEQIGLLWQSSSICPAQEHFASCLIRQKLVAAIDSTRTPIKEGCHTHVLFLPENEIHELGLLYLHFRLKQAGERTIYLGQSVPLADLVHLAAQVPGRITFYGILTSSPAADDVQGYLKGLGEAFPMDRIEFRLSGSRVAAAEISEQVEGIHVTPRYRDMLKSVP